MSPRIELPPLWISLWAALSSVIVLWGQSRQDRYQLLANQVDAAYCFYLPRSFLADSTISWIWAPYKYALLITWSSFKLM
jgi:hypothetical protein